MKHEDILFKLVNIAVKDFLQKKIRIKETILEMIEEDYDMEDITSYINAHL